MMNDLMVGLARSGALGQPWANHGPTDWQTVIAGIDFVLVGLQTRNVHTLDLPLHTKIAAMSVMWVCDQGATTDTQLVSQNTAKS